MQSASGGAEDASLLGLEDRVDQRLLNIFSSFNSFLHLSSSH